MKRENREYFEEQFKIRKNIIIDRILLSMLDLLDPAKEKSAADLLMITRALAIMSIIESGSVKEQYLTRQVGMV